MGTCKKTTHSDEPTSIEDNTRQQQDQREHGALAAEGFSDLSRQSPSLAGAPSSVASSRVPIMREVRGVHDEDDILPWKFVTVSVRTQLIRKLNPEMPMSGNNWRMLADALGYNSEDIRFIESVKGDAAAARFLNVYYQGSVNDLLAALVKINRSDCVEIIKEALPEIRQRAQAPAPSMLHIAETSMMAGGGHPNGSLMFHSGPAGGKFVPAAAIFPNGPNSQPVVSAQGQHGVVPVYCVAGHGSMQCGHLPTSYADSGCSMGQAGAQSYPSLGHAVGGSPNTPPSYTNLGANSVGGNPYSRGNTSREEQHNQIFQRGPTQMKSMAEYGCSPMDTNMSENVNNSNSNFNGGFRSSVNNYCNNETGVGSTYQHSNNACPSSNTDFCSMDVNMMQRQKVIGQYLAGDEFSNGGGMHHRHHKDKRHKSNDGSQAHTGLRTPTSDSACPCSVQQQYKCDNTLHSTNDEGGNVELMGRQNICSNSPCVANTATGLQKLFIPPRLPNTPCANPHNSTQQNFHHANGVTRSSPESNCHHSCTPSSSSPSPNVLTEGVVRKKERCQCKIKPSSYRGNEGGYNGVRPHSGQQGKGFGENPDGVCNGEGNNCADNLGGYYSGSHSCTNHQQFTGNKRQNGGGAAYSDSSSCGQGGQNLRQDNVKDNKQANSLAHLEKIACIPDKYKPTNEYQTVVAEQKIESEKSKKASRSNCKHKTGEPGSPSTIATIHSGHSSSSSSSSSSQASTICSASQTFPQRGKTRETRAGLLNSCAGAVSGVEELSALTISKKSTSMPQDMKPQPFKKAWLGIKVFVTYSMDSREHCDQVLRLGYFLRDNRFNCYLDMPVEASLSPADWLKHTDKFHRKFYESDFIVVCISPKYLQDVSTVSSEQSSVPTSSTASSTSKTPESRLHTLDIYQLMNREYLNRQAFEGGDSGGKCARSSGFADNNSSSLPASELARSPQVVPVLFGDMTADQTPRWMREVGLPCKRWDQDYKDLAWLLTKPQDRIRTNRSRQN